jgi:DNA-binding NtrC family response regulator
MFDSDLLIVDDSQAFCESIVDLLEDENWKVEYVLDGTEAIRRLESSEYRVVLLDLKMPGMSGIEVLHELNKRSLINRNYIIVLTGEITIENAVDSLQYGARDFIQKPAVVEFPDEFVKRIKRGFDWQSERLLNEELRKERQKAIEESQLIVKSVGHDMSGSYYGSLMLRLQTLRRKINQLQEISSTRVNARVNPETGDV